jgi:hypothetical protein
MPVVIISSIQSSRPLEQTLIKAAMSDGMGLWFNTMLVGGVGLPGMRMVPALLF